MKPELAVRSMLHGLGYRFRLHVPSLPGRPDLVFASRKKIIDVRGCFWHQHRGCIDGRIPSSRISYWRPKLAGNKQRDQKNFRRLRALGWKVLVIWECETADLPSMRRRLVEFLKP